MKKLVVIILILLISGGLWRLASHWNSPSVENTGSNSTHAPALLKVNPSVTDNAVSDSFGQHYVYGGPETQEKLFVFLPGSLVHPDSVQLIGKTAAAAGLYSIGLAYANGYTVANVCTDSIDPNCKEKVRLETIEGTDRSTLVDVNSANAIENRLLKLVRYLGTTYPNDHWGQFLTGDALRWDKIIIAGHSQGGGHAALIGKLHTVARVVMFAAPEEADAWTKGDSATPASRFFGLYHLKEHVGSGASRQTAQGWLNIGMQGSASIDGTAPPYGYAQMLTTSSTCDQRGHTWLYYHGCIVADTVTPLDSNGTPLFSSVWKYLMGV